MATNRSAATVTFKGQTHQIGNLSESFQFASFYFATGSDRPLIKVHRTEAAAAKGSWDSAEMKKHYHHAGYTTIDR